jgi:hypothetical protein
VSFLMNDHSLELYTQIRFEHSFCVYISFQRELIATQCLPNIDL